MDRQPNKRRTIERRRGIPVPLMDVIREVLICDFILHSEPPLSLNSGIDALVEYNTPGKNINSSSYLWNHPKSVSLASLEDQSTFSEIAFWWFFSACRSFHWINSRFRTSYSRSWYANDIFVVVLLDLRGGTSRWACRYNARFSILTARNDEMKSRVRTRNESVIHGRSMEAV